MNLIAFLVTIFVASATGTNKENGGCTDPGSSCVPHYLCSSKMSDLIELRSRSDENPCESYLEVCCTKEEQRVQKRNVDGVVSSSKETTIKSNVGCGFRNKDGVGFRITNNDGNGETEFGEYPWMAIIFKQAIIANITVNLFKCGGSLIHPEIVLTAAQCVFNTSAESLKVRLGEWDSQTKYELYAHQDREVAEVVIHKEFGSDTLYNDVALVFLKTPVDIEENVKTICLAGAKTSFDSKRCVVTGWGKDSKNGRYSIILRETDVSVVPRGQCETTLRSTSLGEKFELHSSHICGGSDAGKDLCQGYEGSPLVCPIEGTIDQYQQVGIFSSGIDCGDSAPNVYAGIVELRTWLDEQLASRKVDSNYYTI